MSVSDEHVASLIVSPYLSVQKFHSEVEKRIRHPERAFRMMLDHTMLVTAASTIKDLVAMSNSPEEPPSLVPNSISLR